MKNNHLFSTAILSMLLLLSMPVQAYHLDGLWRNDRHNITLRIESLDEGIRAKRMDQGVWFKYLTKDGRYYIDRLGNTYVIQSENDLVWHEASSGRRINFSRIHNRNNERWDNWDSRNDHNLGHNDAEHNPWESPGHDKFNSLNGRWIDPRRNNKLEIESIRDGIRVRSDRSGWEKYYPDRYNCSYKDKHGNTIQLIDRDSIRVEGRQGRHDRIYHRALGYRNYNSR